MTRITKKKIYTIMLGIGLIVVSYIALKYIFPLVWPFLLAYGIAVILFPVVRFLRDKLHFHKNAATVLTLLLAFGSVVGIVVFVMDKIIIQIKELAEKAPMYQEKLLYYIKKLCDASERFFNIDGETVYGRICDGFGRTIDDWQGNVMPMLMNNSWQTIMILIDVIVVLALTTMAVFYMTRDLEQIREIDERNIFYKEIRYIRGLVSKIVRAYIRSQLIIMSLVAGICVFGLFIIGNKYYILVGILLGILDALPLIGAGAILIPWSIIYIFMGEYVKAAILFTIFVAAYFLREFLEPRLMGQRVGISPIASLISIYVGYQLFGFVGMIAGPLVYVFLKEAIGNVCSR